MPLDGLFIKKLTEEFNKNILGGRIDTIDGLNKTDYVFKIRANSINHNLYLSVSYSNPTVFLSPTKFEKPLVASSFTMFLRKHLEGGYIKKIYQYNNDRVIMMDIETSNEFDGSLTKTLVLELIGRFSNLLILDDEFKVVEAIKQLSVLDENSRGIMKGLKYEPLLNNKLSLEKKDEISRTFSDFSNLTKEKLVETISGFSPLVSKYLIDRYKNSSLDFYDFLIQELNNYEPVMTENDYYYFNIFDKDTRKFDSLSLVLYTYYKEKCESKILKDNNQEIYRCINNNLKRVTKKISKLYEDLEKDKNSDEYRLKGELLLSNAYNSNIERKDTIRVLNYYNNEEIEIPIDIRKSIKDNSQLYYKKYKKAKAAIEHIERELSISNSEKEYFELLSFQLTKATLKDMIEIKNELIHNGYIHSKERQDKRKQKPNFLLLEFNGCKIYVGKNNIQNDYITHTISRKDDLWFHVKDEHGSHVLVQGDNKYDEEVIRYAAKLASQYSNAKDSSSVPVDYTEIKYLKKVPGNKGSFVTYKKNKTIYIDPKR